MRELVSTNIGGGKRYAKIYGLSTDDKPKAGLVTGSEFIEVNTGDRYLFDETGTGAWTKVAAGWVNPDA